MDTCRTCRVPWYVPMICLSVIPLVSEFLCPVLVLAALLTAIPVVRAAGRLRFGFLGGVLLVYIVYMLVGMLYSEHRLSTLASVLLWVQVLAVYLIAVNTVTSAVRLYRLIVFTALVAAAVGVLAAAGYALYRSGLCGPDALRLWNPFEQWLSSVFGLDFDLSYNHGRAAATFCNPNLMGEYFSVVLPFVACGAFYLPDRTHRTVCRACLLPMMVGIVVSYSRGSYVAVVFFIIFMVLAGGLSRCKLFLGGVALWYLIPAGMLERFASIGNMGDHAISSRLRAWQIAIESLPDRFFFGRGAGIMASKSLLEANGMPDQHTHNLILQLMLEGGVVAVGILAVMGLRVFLTGTRILLNQKRDRRLGLSLVGFFITFAVHGMFDWPLMMPKSVAVFALALGLCDIMTHIYLHNGHTLSLRRKEALP